MEDKSDIPDLLTNQNYSYTIYDKYTCTQNIDRIKFYNNLDKNEKIKALSVGYHLDPKTQIKTGGIFFFDISPSNKKLIPLETENISLDYGILDIKFSKDNSKLFTANSDYSFTIFTLNDKQFIKNKIYLINDDKKKSIPNDTLEISKNEEKIFFGANDGNIYINDLIKNENFLNLEKAHEYGIWSLYLLESNENLFMSGGEDSQIKLWDLRSKSCVNKNNKTYQSSINHINKLKNNENIIITGSYDEKCVFFDIRKFPAELYSIKTEHSIWDIKQCNLNEKNLLLMASIYEGFNIWDFDNKEDGIKMNHLLRLPLTKSDIFHKKIVYGVDIKLNQESNSIDVLSCSFYDNLIMYWNYAMK